MQLTPSSEKWISQLRKGYLELCVMVILGKVESSYGFALLDIFRQAGLEVNEGTLYPMLNRLFKNGWLESQWETPDDGGHPRRFYSLSIVGRKLLPWMLSEYQHYQNSLDILMEVK